VAHRGTRTSACRFIPDQTIGRDQLLLTVFVNWHIRSEFAQEKLPDQIIDGVAGGAYEGIAQREAGSTVSRWIVKIGEAARREAAKDAGVVWLGAPIVSLVTTALEILR
jgi:hypothetical protein